MQWSEMRPRPYKWRGRTYKTVSGLHNAVRTVHKSCGLGFEPDFMVVSIRMPDQSRLYYKYRRDLDTNEIADQHEGA